MSTQTDETTAPTDQEYAELRLSVETLRDAIDALHLDGPVTLAGKDTFADDYTEEVRDRLVGTINEQQAAIVEALNQTLKLFDVVQRLQNQDDTEEGDE